MSVVLRLLLVLVLAAATGAVLATEPRQPDHTSRPSRIHTRVHTRARQLAHLIVCGAMIGMLWPGRMTSAPRWQPVALGAATLWFLTAAITLTARRTRARPGAPESGLWPAAASGHHAVTAATMTWMDTGTPTTMPGHGTGAHLTAMLATTPHSASLPGPANTAAALLGGYFLLAALPWIRAGNHPDRTHPTRHGVARRRVLYAAGNAAMTAGMGLMLIAHTT